MTYIPQQQVDVTPFNEAITVRTTQKNAYEIENWLNNNQSVWVADQIGSTVIISAQSDGAKAGTYTYSHATSTGTITYYENL